jgi:hypothetical protein
LSHVIYREFIDLGSFSIVIECEDQCNLHHYPINISKESVILNLWFGDTIFHDNRFNHFDREAQMDENAKKLKKMATWTVAVFATLFALVMTVLWIPLFNSSGSAINAIWQAFGEGWLIILIAFVLCVGTYIGYSLYLKGKK